MIIDCYGNRFPHKGFEQKRPYMVNDAGSGVIYMCYSDAAVKPIIRITDDGNGLVNMPGIVAEVGKPFRQPYPLLLQICHAPLAISHIDAARVMPVLPDDHHGA